MTKNTFVAGGGITFKNSFRKNPNGCWGTYLATYFFEKNPEIFRFVALPLRILGKTKLHHRKFPQNCATPLGNSKAKNQDTWNCSSCSSSLVSPEVVGIHSLPSTNLVDHEDNNSYTVINQFFIYPLFLYFFIL